MRTDKFWRRRRKRKRRGRRSFGRRPATAGKVTAPLSETVHVCVLQQIDLHYSCISRLCTRYFLEELNLLGFFRSLRKFYMMEVGDCTFNGEAAFPFTLFFDGDVKADYEKVFQCFSRLRSSSAVLKDIWSHLVKEGKKEHGSSRREDLLLLMEMQHFVQKIESSIVIKKEILVREFETKVRRGGNICDIQGMHKDFVRLLLDLCWLLPKHVALANLLHTALQTCEQVRDLLAGEDEDALEMDLERAHQRFRNARVALNINF